ncbi:MAG: NAD(P)/FAD-dependent oxidoreductase [Candidatus Methanodesulfokora sp.]
MTKNVLIVGGGTGGTIAANLLSYKLREEIRRGEVRIQLIEQSKRHFYQPAYLLIPFGLSEVSEAVKSERELLSESVELITERATRINVEDRFVETEKGKYTYDYLIIATGSVPDPSQVQGLSEGAHHFYDLDSSLKLEESLAKFNGGKIVVGVAGVPYKCPPAPLEFTFLVEDYFRRRHMRNKVEIEYLYPLPRVFPIESVADFAYDIMLERGIKANLLFNIESVDPGKKEIISMEGDSTKYDLAVIIPPHRGADVIIKSGIGDKGGWIPTDRYTLNMKNYDDVYVIGDATDLPISKAGSTADFEASVVSSRIADSIRGIKPRAVYDGRVMCFLLSKIGEGSLLVFDYENPPKPAKPNFFCYWYKMAYNRLYWNITARALLPGFGV